MFGGARVLWTAAAAAFACAPVGLGCASGSGRTGTLRLFCFVTGTGVTFRSSGDVSFLAEWPTVTLAGPPDDGADTAA